MAKTTLFLMVRQIDLDGKFELILRAVPPHKYDRYISKGWEPLEEYLDNVLFAHQ